MRGMGSELCNFDDATFGFGVLAAQSITLCPLGHGSLQQSWQAVPVCLLEVEKEACVLLAGQGEAVIGRTGA